jgi:hypothetical protein
VVIRPAAELDGAVRYPDLWGDEARAHVPEPSLAPEPGLAPEPETAPEPEPEPPRPAARAVVPFVPDPDPVVPDDDEVLPVGEQAVLDVDGAVEWRRPRAGTLLVRSSAENARRTRRARPRPPRGSSRPCSTSTSRRRSSGRSRARTSPATSCAWRPA